MQVKIIPGSAPGRASGEAGASVGPHSLNKAKYCAKNGNTAAGMSLLDNEAFIERTIT